MTYNEFDLCIEEANKIVFSGEEVYNGIIFFCDSCKEIIFDNIWDEITKLKYDDEEAELKNWIQGLLIAEPPDKNTNSLWLISSLDNSKIVFETSDKYDPDGHNENLHHLLKYESKNKIYPSKILEDVNLILKHFINACNKNDNKKIEFVNQTVIQLFPYVYSSLLIKNICKSIPADIILNGSVLRYIGALAAKGNWRVLGELTRDGFKQYRYFETVKTEELKKIKNFPSRVMAEEAKQILENQGIYSIIQSADFGILGSSSIGLPQGADLFVPENRALEAENIIFALFGNI